MASSKKLREFKRADVVIFDLDGTLTESKANLKPRMAKLLVNLLSKKRIAIIGGGRYLQFRDQFLMHLKCPSSLFSNLYLFPTNATTFYRYTARSWKEVYHRNLSLKDKKEIIKAFHVAFEKIGYEMPRKIWGPTLDDRKSEMTFSALGQKAPLDAKKKWNKNEDIRPRLMGILQKLLPRFEVREGGETSIDVTRKAIDKAYGVREISKYLKIPVVKMVFVGDELQRGGNDAAAKLTGIRCVAVRGPADTERFIKDIL
jgi:HAD superfamily hydrolase (TIGR01484 family)